jgi:type II secretory ATPase GspE/PulE/Tfp pilus assembly ATPase PilB-like protein
VIDNIKGAFVKQGMYSMKQDGIFKAMRGLTTMGEVWDATRA